MSLSLVVLRVGDQFLGVDVHRTRAVMRPVPVAAVPGSSDFVSGVANIDGTIIAILDVAKRLGMRSDVQERLCLVETANGVAALLVDDVLEVVTVHEQDMTATVSSPWVIAACMADLTHSKEEPEEALILVLDTDLVSGVAA